MSVTKLYNAWFCPFGQRAWIALIHKGVDFEYVEQNPYDKTPEWLAVNPRGLVPTIVNNGHSVYDSFICVEYVDEAWPNSKNLLPKDPYQRAWARIWSDHISKKIVPSYYAVLMKKNEEEREHYKQELLTAVSLISDNMSEEGPFFLGTDFGMVDIMLAPFAQRLDVVMKHFRNFGIPDNEMFARYHRWWKAVQEVPSFKATVQPEEKLRNLYQRYADGTATWEVAEAIRKGTTLP